jgi:hypothetical protein
MDKKVYKTLSEAYQDVSNVNSFEEMQPEIKPEMGNEFSDNENAEASLEDMEKEKSEMVQTRLNSLIAHAQQALHAVKMGGTIEPWIQDLITTSEGNIVKTANYLVYKHEI